MSADESENIRVALQSLPPECAPSVSVLMQLVMSHATNFAVQSMLEFIPEDKRRAVAYTVADKIVDATALLGEIFTASATKEVFGWGRHFNINQKNSTNSVLAPLIDKAQSNTSPLDITMQTPEQKKLYETWKGSLSPAFVGLQGVQPIVMVSLGHLRDIANLAAKDAKGTPSYPEGFLSDEQWEIEADIDEGLQSILNTDVPLHIGYQFSIGPQVAVHHAVYFGKNSGPDGGLVIEVMNRVFGSKNEVTSFIAPSTLLNFMRRTATNGLNGMLVYYYRRPMAMEVALDRAMWAVGKFNYNVMKHNCENFVSWVLQNIDSNTTCATFRTTARTFVASKLNVSAGKKKLLKHKK